MNDGSLASLTEQWIADAIAALPAFPAENVEPYPGSTSISGEQLVEEFMGHRTPYVAVLFEGDQPVVLEEGEHGYEAIYGIYVAARNERPGAARKGDGTTPGTNLYRDLLRNALHDQFPNLAANGFYTDRAIFRGARVIFERRDAFVLRAELAVRESPQA